jgi:1-acyl-sn-glycerol-3-phosphate acyltransferase
MLETRWQYHPVADFDQSIASRLHNFPREPDILVYAMRSVAALSIRAWLKVYCRFEIFNREHLPMGKSFVMVANHSSHLDALCLLAALPLGSLNRAYPAAASDYFFVSLPRLAVAAVVVNAMPFSRQVHVRHSLDLCRHLLTRPGTVLILFPEGTRSPKGELGEFRPGIGSLLAGLDAEVVPCGIQGASRALPKGAKIPRPCRITLNIGAPRTYRDLQPGKDATRQISQQLRDAVGGLICN